MKYSKTRGLTVLIVAMTVPIVFVMSAGFSEAQKLAAPAKAVTTMRAPTLTIKSLGGNTGHMAPGPATVGANTPRFTTFSTVPGTRGTMRPKDPYTLLPDAQSGETINDPTVMSPSDLHRDPSDIFDFADMNRNIANEKIDEKWLLGPDRDGVPYPSHKFDDGWYADNSASDISNSSCMWDAATRNKVENWGGDGSNNPLIQYDEDGDICPAPNDDSSDGKGGDGGSKPTGGKDTSHKDTETKVTVKESTPIKDQAGKQDGERGEPEGDDPDEFRSPASQEAVQRIYEAINSGMFDAPVGRVSRSELGGQNSGDKRGPGFGIGSTPDVPQGNTYGPGNYMNFHKDTQPLMPYVDRPDVLESPVSSGIMNNPMGQMASPAVGPDGPGSGNPDPGPTAGPAMSTTAAPSASGDGTTMDNPMGNAMSPGIGDGGPGPDNPDPGPK